MARSKVSQVLAEMPEDIEETFQEEIETEPELQKKIFNIDNYKIYSEPEKRNL